MSLWTPGGEHPVDRGGPSEPAAPPAGGALGAMPGGGPAVSPDQEADAHEIAAEMAEVRAQLSQVPAAQVIANHAMGCWELAAIHLGAEPPRLAEAALAIDAVGCLVEGLGLRLGPDSAALTDALANIRLAFVQIKNAAAPTA